MSDMWINPSCWVRAQLAQFRESTSRVWMAIILSSSVGMTHAEVGLSAVVMRGPARGVGGGIEAHAQPLGAPADRLADRCGVLADAGGEHQSVDAAECRRQRAQLLGDAVDEQLDRLMRPRLGARQQLAHVVGDAGDAEQARLLVEQRLDLRAVPASAAGSGRAARPDRASRCGSPSAGRRRQ